MIRLGAHVSVAGGLPRAVERAVVHSADAFQIFSKNANQWRGRDALCGNP
jgi:deoxyribonuclease-4